MINSVIRQFLAKKAANRFDPSTDPYFDPLYLDYAEKYQKMFPQFKIIGMVTPHLPIFDAPTAFTNHDPNYGLHTFSSAQHAKAAKLLKERLERMNQHAKILHEQGKVNELKDEFYEDVEDLRNQIQIHEKAAKSQAIAPFFQET